MENKYIWYLHIKYYPISELKEAAFFTQGYFKKKFMLPSHMKGIMAVIPNGEKQLQKHRFAKYSNQ